MVSAMVEQVSFIVGVLTVAIPAQRKTVIGRRSRFVIPARVGA